MNFTRTSSINRSNTASNSAHSRASNQPYVVKDAEPTMDVADHPPPAAPRRRRFRSASPVVVRPRLPPFLAKLPNEDKASFSRTKKQQPAKPRPCSPPRVHRRSNSFTRLFPSRKASAAHPASSEKPSSAAMSSWANDSVTTASTEATFLHSSYNTSFNTSFSSAPVEDQVDELVALPDEDWVVQAFVSELELHIQQNTHDKDKAEERIVTLHEMAWARYDSGSETGALLSMRQAHKYMVRVHQLEVALQQLHFLRQQVTWMEDYGATSITEQVKVKRRAMVVILSKLKRDKLAKSVERPSDAQLLRQLYEIMEVVEI